MTSTLTFKKEKNNLFNWITKLINSKNVTKKISQNHEISDEELLEFEKWCSLQ